MYLNVQTEGISSGQVPGTLCGVAGLYTGCWGVGARE